MSTDTTESAAMRRAIALSALGLSTTSPNPPVGCVILDATAQPVGEGYHRRKGEPHAEANALAAAGPQAAGGTAVVTLEPCNHYGRTPPCHQALIEAGIARVLIAIIDPTSRSVGGAARLRNAGVEVDVGLLADEARVVLGPWLVSLNSQQPRVIWACELTGDYSNPLPDTVLAEAGLRYQVDAIVHADGHVEEGAEGTHGENAFALPPVVPIAEPHATLSSLYTAGARTVLLHGGRELASSFLDLQLVDEARMFVEETAPSHTVPSADHHSVGPLALFRIRAVRKLSSGVLVEASMTSASDTSAL